MGDVDNDTHASAPEPAGPEAVAASPSKPPSRSTEPVWDRIKRHKVVEWTLAYVAFGYALLHGVQMLRETFEWPLLVSRLTVVGLVLGAPIAVTLAFYHGHRAQHRVSRQELSILIALLVVAGSVLWWVSRHERSVASATISASSPAASQAPFNPPAHSIAVLPFVNMSEDKEQEYFSEGLTEELLNSLSRINELQVAARTSSFSFQGEHPDIATVAHKLNVGAVLEGSVRRSANTVRITAQLVNGVTGFHLWSETYDRDLRDVLKLQTELATAVASALKVTLLGNEAAKIQVGGTRNPAALDGYLRGSQTYATYHEKKDLESAIYSYTEAIQLDPSYALAFAGRSTALDELASYWVATMRESREVYDKAMVDARKAVELAPDLGEAHLVLANALTESLELRSANNEYQRAQALAPGDARILQDYGSFQARMGRADEGIAAVRRAVALDPLNRARYEALFATLLLGRQYEAANAAVHEALVLDPNFYIEGVWEPDYMLGNYQRARATCEAELQHAEAHLCLALVYEKLGRHHDGEAQLAKYKDLSPEDWSQFSGVYAQWGDVARALSCLDEAVRIHHVGLQYLKVEPLWDPLRKEPRFQAIERALRFPD